MGTALRQQGPLFRAVSSQHRVQPPPSPGKGLALVPWPGQALPWHFLSLPGRGRLVGCDGGGQAVGVSAQVTQRTQHTQPEYLEG